MYTADKEWETFGKNNPYYGVIIDDAYKAENLTDDSKQKFFATGEIYASSIFAVIEKNLGKPFSPEKAIDFGCGVGRLTIPLAKRCGHMTGIDISESVLKEATANAKNLGLKNVDFKLFNDTLIPTGKFDFINTFIVLQHIVTERGMQIINDMLTALENGGIATLHVTFTDDNAGALIWRNRMNDLTGKSKLLSRLHKLYRKVRSGISTAEPIMQMNYYNVNAIYKQLYDHKCFILHTEFTNHGGAIGSLLFIQKGISGYEF